MLRACASFSWRAHCLVILLSIYCELTIIELPAASLHLFPACDESINIMDPPNIDICSCSSIGQQDGSEDTANIDIAALTELSEIIVDEIRSNQWGGSSPGTQIFRVSKDMLRAAGEGAYTPTFLSMGPYHHGSAATTEEMRLNEQGKLVVLGKAIKDGGPSVLEYVKDIMAIEAKARMCYEGDISMERGAFCKMLLLDGMQLISVLEFIGLGLEENKVEAGDAAANPSKPTGTTCCDAVAVAVQQIIRKSNKALCWRGQNDATDDCGIELSSCDIAVVVQAGNKSQSEGGSEDDGDSQHGNVRVKTRNLIRTLHDLMILENQIPFFVVERIYALRYANSPVTEYGEARPAAMELAWRAMTAIMNSAPTAASQPVKECKHLIHLCHVYLKPTFVAPQHKKPDTYGGRFWRATEYYEAGVKFRPWNADDTGSPRPLLDVTFSNGVLMMAEQTVDDMTDYILRNVLAYEQRYATFGGGYVTAYVTFMSQLLEKPEDVALLKGKGIMWHLLGSDAEVSELFRGLADGLTFVPADGHYLNWVGVALRGHCRRRRHQLRARVRGSWWWKQYFGHPCHAAAWVLGAITVLCTILQTVFAVLSYFNGAQTNNN